MAIEIQETFQVRAPIEAVWQFLLDPQRVVVCMPGAELEEVVDDRTFLGNIKIKVGPITTSYKGRVQLTEVDQQQYAVQMVAEGREASGGIAKGTMSSRLRALPDGQTEVVTETSIDIAGRIMQFGRGMIQDVSHQLFQQFVACAKEQLEAPEGAAAEEPVATAEAEPVRIFPLALRALWSAIVRFFRRLFGRPAA
jgi:hypothetical protein